MINKLFNNVLVILCLLFTNTIYADQTPIEHLKSLLASTHSLSAEFRQVTLDERGQATQTSYGDFYLSRPGKFRWNYKKPFIQEIVSNTGKVWFYDTDLEQVTIKKLDASKASTPALLLSGDIDLEENYTLKQQGKDEDLQWVKLTPKDEDSSFKYVLIGLDNDQLGGMELSDNFGQLTRIYFSKVKKNPQLDDSLFEFIAPKGVDVFEN